MTPDPSRGRVAPALLLAAFVALLLVPTVLAAAALAAAALAAVVVERVRAGEAARVATRSEAASGPVATVLGRTEQGKPFSLTDLQLSAHTLILGATGAGKSNTLLTIVGDHVERGRGAVVIDMKGSREFARSLAAVAARGGRPFHVWTLDGPGHWNPLAHGNPSELKDRLISAERWSEVHYQRAAELYLQTALTVWAHARPGSPPTLADVVGLLDRRRLAAMVRDVPRELASPTLSYLSELTPDQLSAVQGLKTRLALLAGSSAGPYLKPGEATTIDLQAAVRGREVVLFSLNSSRYGQLAAQVGALVAQELNSVMGTQLERGEASEPFMVGVDELSALGPQHALNLIARGREASFPTVLATQELADLEVVSRGLAKQMLGIPGTKIVHRQDLPESARLIAEVAGTERVWEHTYQTDRGALRRDRDTGRGTRREVERYRVEPETIRTRSAGEAVVITKIPNAAVSNVRVRPPPRRDGPVRPPPGRDGPERG